MREFAWFPFIRLRGLKHQKTFLHEAVQCPDPAASLSKILCSTLKFEDMVPFMPDGIDIYGKLKLRGP